MKPFALISAAAAALAKGNLGDTETIENKVLAFERERMLAMRVAKAPDNFPFRARVGEMWTVLYFQP